MGSVCWVHVHIYIYIYVDVCARGAIRVQPIRAQVGPQGPGPPETSGPQGPSLQEPRGPRGTTRAWPARAQDGPLASGPQEPTRAPKGQAYKGSYRGPQGSGPQGAMGPTRAQPTRAHGRACGQGWVWTRQETIPTWMDGWMEGSGEVIDGPNGRLDTCKCSI